MWETAASSKKTPTQIISNTNICFSFFLPFCLSLFLSFFLSLQKKILYTISIIYSQHKNFTNFNNKKSQIQLFHIHYCNTYITVTQSFSSYHSLEHPHPKVSHHCQLHTQLHHSPTESNLYTSSVRPTAAAAAAALSPTASNNTY